MVRMSGSIASRSTSADRVVRRTPPPIPSGAGPIVKWVGGKSKLLPELLARIPGSYRRYFEPFVGGGALFFRLGPAAAMLTDSNAELIHCYQTVRDDVESVIRALGKHRTRHSEEYYYAVREGWNGPRRTEIEAGERAATFLYLNKTCYNGLWRVNSRGAFNVPAGRYENPSILDPDALRAASRVLANATLATAPFEKALAEAKRGDFVYMDPPYHPISSTAYFTSYTADRFSAADQERLADTFRALDDRGVAVMLSNSDTPFIRKLYAGYQIDRVYAPRAINSNAANRGNVAEVLVMNRY
jgi:DNA adenine methylase